MKIKTIIGTIFWSIIVIFLLMVVFGTIYTVPAGHRGVITTFGEVDLQERGEGLHFKIPIMQKVTKIPVQTQKYQTGASSASKDLQIVTTSLALNYRLVDSEVPMLYQTVGMSYVERIIEPALQETIKSTTAQFTAEELITRRTEVRVSIQESLKERLEGRAIFIESVSITDFDFSKSFNDAIEMKVVAEQRKLQAERDLQRIEIEAQQKIVSAQAEAESIRIQTAALKEDNSILQLRAIEKWDGVMPKVTGGAMPFIQVDVE